MNRTPHGTPMPLNANQLGRPVYAGPLTATDIEFLESPDLVRKINDIHKLDPVFAHEVVLSLRQHRRALDNGRSLPGEWNGRDDQPHQPRPFQGREQPHPLREAHTRDGAAMRKAVETVDATLMTSALAARMRSHDSDSQDSTWNRMAPASERQSTDRPPSLRDSIQASADALGDNNG